ncbi:hypothetical protein GCM10009612_59640 [Streptomyces beijiangensis]
MEMDCSVYVDTRNLEWLRDFLCEALQGDLFSSSQVICSAARIYVAHNDYETDGNDPSDFIQWPSVLECEPLPEVENQDFVAFVNRLLQSIWGTERRAVAACDFEDLLPNSGGRDLYVH